jgi:hypothetical protein
MKHSLSSVARKFVALAVFVLGSMSHSWNIVAAESPGPVKLALLVGVGRYAHLPASEQLDGCANDVAAMRELLQSRFGFAQDAVTTLVDDQATGDAVRRAFTDLIAQVNKSADGADVQVVFHFSGHGSQVADQPEGSPDCDEPDGLDETLVPYDAKSQGGDEDLRDDELNAFAEAVAAHPHARLTVVLDCCHSGSGARGATKLRRLSRGLRTLPDDAPTERRVREKLLPDRVVMLSACRAQEVEPEYQEGDKTYGLLTRFVVQALTQAPSASTLNYEQLRQAVLHGYQASAGIPQAPLPQLEGKPADLRTAVLGADAKSDLPPYFTAEPVSTDSARARLAAGAFHGVTVGSVFELVATEAVLSKGIAAESGDGALLLRIEKVDAGGASGKLQKAAGNDFTAARWPRDWKVAAAIKRFHESGDAGLRMAVVRAEVEGSDGPRLTPETEGLEVVRRAVEKARRKDESPWLTWTTDDSAVDVLLRVAGGRAAFFPATGVTLRAAEASTSHAPLRGGWGPITLADADAETRIVEYLRRISLARNLVRLAGSQAAAQQRKSPLSLELVHVELDPQAGIVDSGSWQPADDGSLTMRAGDYYALRLTNPAAAAAAVYATVLVIGPNLDVQVAFPKQAGVGLVDDQVLQPGQVRLSDGFACDDVAGERWAIVLATPQPHDLTYVAQDELPTVRAGSDAFNRMLQSYTVRRTRGDQRLGGAANPPAWSAGLIRWEARP